MGVGNGLRQDVWREFQSRFGNIKMCEVYGSTEGNLCFMNHIGKIGTVGRSNFFYRVSSWCLLSWKSRMNCRTCLSKVTGYRTKWVSSRRTVWSVCPWTGHQCWQSSPGCYWLAWWLLLQNVTTACKLNFTVRGKYEAQIKTEHHVGLKVSSVRLQNAVNHLHKQSTRGEKSSVLFAQTVTTPRTQTTNILIKLLFLSVTVHTAGWANQH